MEESATSEIIYNGQVLNYLSTLEVRYDPVMDDMAGVDYECTKITITSAAIVTPNVAPALPGETAAQTMARVSHLLNTPRRGLIYAVNGVTLVSQVAAGGNTTTPVRDVRNGPYTSVTVTRIVGTECLAVLFRVETYKVDCPEATQPPPFVSLRWTDTADLNELAMTRRTRTGRIVARADILANADQLRGIVMPALEPTFRRLSSQYTLSADGRVCAFKYVDDEQYLMPPAPAAKAEGHFAITCKDGSSYWAEVQLRLQGGKPTDKATLLRRAMAIALAKITNANPPTVNGGFILTGTMSEDMFANDVSVRLSAMVQPTKARLTTQSASRLSDLGNALWGLIKFGGAGIGISAIQAAMKAAGAGGTQAPGISAPASLDAFKVPAEYGAQSDFAPGTAGSAQLLLLAQGLSDPCLRATILTALGQSQNTPTQEGQTTPATLTIQDTVPDDNNSFRTDGLTAEEPGIYQFYEISTRDTKQYNVFSLPVGKKDADAAIIQTAAPVVRRRVEWKASKVGGKPVAPEPELADTNWTLTGTQIEIDNVEPIADGAILRVTIAGVYHYVGKSVKPQGQTHTLTAAVPPWVDPYLAGAFARSPLAFMKGILEPWLGFSLTTGGGSSLSTGGGGIIPGVNG